MSKYLKLVGLETFNSESTGIVRKGDVILVDDEERYEELLEQGTMLGEGDDAYFKPYFVESSKPSSPATRSGARRVLTEAEIAAQDAAEKQTLGESPAQAPVGQGRNQAENTDGPAEVDSVDEGALDPAYHPEAAEEQAEGAKTAAPRTRQRTSK